MQERIFNPIGMESAILTLDLPAIGGDYATGYAFNLVTNTFEPIRNPNLTGDTPAGSASVNVIDMARFLIMQLNRGVVPRGTCFVHKLAQISHRKCVDSVRDLAQTNHKARIVSVDNLVKTWEPHMKINDPMFYLPYPLAQPDSLHSL